MFLLLLLCLFYDVCGVALDAGQEIVLHGERYFKVTDAESVLYGFCYAQEQGATAKHTLQDIKKARADERCIRIYRGHGVDLLNKTVFETVHFSVIYEHHVSMYSTLSFLQQYDLQDAFICVCLEDLGDFCFCLDRNICQDTVQVALPTEAYSSQKYPHSTYGFCACLQRYKEQGKRSPIVFLSSGRKGLTRAGEFLFHVKQEIGDTYACVNFFFTALEEEDCVDVRYSIALQASYLACFEDIFPSPCYPPKYWCKVFDRCARHVGCQKIHDKRVVLANDEGNIFAPVWSDAVPRHLKYRQGPWDVFVGWPSVPYGMSIMPTSTMKACYLARAYSLFKDMSKRLGAGCITGQENKTDLPDKSQHTLLCVKDMLFSNAFVASMQAKFQYKNVEFLDMSLMTTHPRSGACNLVVGGSVEADFSEDSSSFEVLFISPVLLREHPLENNEKSVVIDGHVYEKVRDDESRKHGFVYAPKGKSAAGSLLRDIRCVQEDFSCDKVYFGFYEKELFAKIDAVVHMSAGYEKALSEQAVVLLLSKHPQLQNGTFYTSFEDIGYFVDSGKFLQSRSVCAGAPKGAGRFLGSGNFHRPGSPIVFCASGRDGFDSAGEFLYALAHDEKIRTHRQRISFLITAIAKQCLKDGDVRKIILAAANSVDPNNDDYADFFDMNVEYVMIAYVYDGRVLHAQDRGNLLVGLKPQCTLVDKTRLYDVLVDWLPRPTRDAMSLAYWQSAHFLFEEMRKSGAGCAQDRASVDFSRNNQRSLLCVNSERFYGAEAFGHSVARKLRYKDVVFVSCGEGDFYGHERFVAKGVVQEGFMPDNLIVWNYAHQGASYR